MADEQSHEQADEYICPACSAPVEADAHSCPSCGVAFDAAEGEAPGAPTEADPSTSLDDLEREILGGPSAAPAEADPSAELKQDTSAAAEPEPADKASADEAPADEAPADEAPADEAERPPAPKAKGLVGHLGGRLGTVGFGLLAAGALAALVALNYDTWVRGQSTSSVGSLQESAVLAATALAVAGFVVWLVAGGILKRRGARAP